MLLPSDPAFQIIVRDLTKSYGDSLVLDHVSLNLESGSSLPCLIGSLALERPRFSGSSWDWRPLIPEP